MASKGSENCPAGPSEGRPSCSLSPYLVVQGADRCIEFMEKAFGGQLMCKYYGGEAGAEKGTEKPAEKASSGKKQERKIMHAEVRIKDSVVMIGEASDCFSPAVPSHLHLYVDNVDEVYKRALSLGATSVQEPRVRGGDDTDKRGGVKDVTGNTWWISTTARSSST